MAWLSVGSASAIERSWSNVGPIQSDILRLRYTFSGDVPSRPIQGFLRERYDINLYNSRWYNLYPKTPETEVLILDRSPGFEGTIYQARTLQVRKRGSDSFNWIVHIDQWL